MKPTLNPSCDGPTRALQRLLPWLRTSIGIMWIVTGVVSAGVYPLEASYALLEQAGVPSALAPVALFGAVALNLLLGVLSFVPRGRRLVWAAQAALVAAYTLVITIKLPQFWLHPYGPILKNLPILVVLWLLYATEPSGRRDASGDTPKQHARQ